MTDTTTKTPQIGTCNLYPRIWAAIFGCAGRGTFLRWDAPTTMHGRYSAVYACEGCRCAKGIGDAAARLGGAYDHGAHPARSRGRTFPSCPRRASGAWLRTAPASGPRACTVGSPRRATRTCARTCPGSGDRAIPPRGMIRMAYPGRPIARKS